MVVERVMAAVQQVIIHVAVAAAPPTRATHVWHHSRVSVVVSVVVLPVVCVTVTTIHLWPSLVVDHHATAAAAAASWQVGGRRPCSSRVQTPPDQISAAPPLMAVALAVQLAAVAVAAAT